MKSLWNTEEADLYADNDLALRVYSSRLLGADPHLVMHGGGNTSVKVKGRDFFGRELDILHVKGSGWDLATIEEPGFPALRLQETAMLAELESLSDVDMTRELRALMLDPGAPDPSVETILHAIIPFRFVDHSHADAVVTLTNNPNGSEIVSKLYPDCLLLPYVMPGFVLARQVWLALQDTDLGEYKGIILAHHGVFTFGDDARIAYENMIELISRAEDYAAARYTPAAREFTASPDLRVLATIRHYVSMQRGCGQLAVLDMSADARAYACLPEVKEISSRGPITPDHVIRTKRIPVIIEDDPATAVNSFSNAYVDYFERYSSDDLTMLDTAPRVGIWRNHGSISFGCSIKECSIIQDIARHTRAAILTGEALGGWEALPAEKIFELEYWSLEQAKLKRGGSSSAEFSGRIAMVTGAASGIGLETCKSLVKSGVVVVGLDINPDVTNILGAFDAKGVVCNVCDQEAVRQYVDDTVASFGGLDILVCNAGSFSGNDYIECLNQDSWDSTLALNLTATQRLISAAIPYLKLGVNPSIVVIGSRNVPAPGPGASAYSVSKAGLTQLARVAALELADAGVRVNVIHPDAVFDTGLWTDQLLKASADRYGLTVGEYKTRNMLGREILAADVAAVVLALAGELFRATTGAQIPVDGGSERVL